MYNRITRIRLPNPLGILTSVFNRLTNPVTDETVVKNAQSQRGKLQIFFLN